MEGNLPLFGFAAIMCSEWFSTADSVEDNVIMANQEQNPCNKQQLESDEPQLGAPSQSSFSLPPPPPVQMF